MQKAETETEDEGRVESKQTDVKAARIMLPT